MGSLLIILAVFLGVAGVVGAAAWLLSGFGASHAEDRLDILTGQKAPKLEMKSILKEQLGAPGESAGFLETMQARFTGLGRLFDQADVRIAPTQFFAICGLLAAGGFAVGTFLGMPLGLVITIACMLGALPLAWLLHKRRRRLKILGTQLPDALELVARALRAGHSLAAGMNVVAEEMPAPIAEEFRRVYEEQNLGVALETAMKAMAERVPNLDLRFFVTAVILQRQTGGDMAEILDKIGYVIRERFKIQGQVRALTAEGRLSGVILMLLPIALFLAVYQLNPTYVSLLFTEELGRKMLIFAGIMQVLGALTIRKIVNIRI